MQGTPFAPAKVTLAQAAQAVSAALALAGGPDVVCTTAVPFISVPGLQLSTLPGEVSLLVLLPTLPSLF